VERLRARHETHVVHKNTREFTRFQEAPRDAPYVCANSGSVDFFFFFYSARRAVGSVWHIVPPEGHGARGELAKGLGAKQVGMPVLCAQEKHRTPTFRTPRARPHTTKRGLKSLRGSFFRESPWTLEMQ